MGSDESRSTAVPSQAARVARWWVRHRYLPAIRRRLPPTPDGDPDLHHAAREAGVRLPPDVLPLWFPHAVVRSFIPLVAASWKASEGHSPPGVYAALKGLEDKVGDPERARHLAAGVGVRLALARAREPRTLRLGTQWVKRDGDPVPVRADELRTLADAFRHLKTESIKAAEAWLLDRPYCPGRGTDTPTPLDDAVDPPEDDEDGGSFLDQRPDPAERVEQQVIAKLWTAEAHDRAGLSEMLWEAVYLADALEVSSREGARRAGCSVAAFKVRVHRGRKKLRAWARSA